MPDIKTLYKDANMVAYQFNESGPIYMEWTTKSQPFNMMKMEQKLREIAQKKLDYPFMILRNRSMQSCKTQEK